MAEAGQPDEQPKRYAVRLSPRADRDRLGVFDWLMDNASEEAAANWLLGLDDALAKLAQNPGRTEVQPNETKLIGAPVRRYQYRRTPGGTQYNVLYLIQEDSPDGPYLLVFHIRNATRAPMTKAEAKVLRGEM